MSASSNQWKWKDDCNQATMVHRDGCPSGKKIRYMYCDIVTALFFFPLSVLDAPAVLFHIAQFLLNEKQGWD